MADPYQHLDMTPEYNRIITAPTGIRDDIRLLRTVQEDPESGIVTNGVMNDFQRAMIAVTLGGAAGSIASAINAGTVSVNGSGIAEPSGDSNADLNAERANILAALGVEEDPADLKVLMREAGFYYWEAKGTAGPDDGLRGSHTHQVKKTPPITQITKIITQITGATTLTSNDKNKDNCKDKDERRTQNHILTTIATNK